MIETYLSAVIMLYVLACSFIVLSHVDKKRSDVWNKTADMIFTLIFVTLMVGLSVVAF
jgi:NADH:ubiquinone oxidoreductase subunit 6 (subunit J)